MPMSGQARQHRPSRRSEALSLPVPERPRAVWKAVGQAVLRRATFALGIAILLPATARADAPLNYLITHGSRAQAIAVLAWFTIIVSLVVIAVVTGLLLAGIWRRRAMPDPVLPGRAFVERPQGGIAWIYIGVGATLVVLLITMVWTFATLARTGPTPGPPALRLLVTGHQWWWDVRYLSDDPSQEFTTANEIHIPVGKVIEIQLRGADVIHSFWVPALAGKTDMIPGQQNQTWMDAQRPGIYRGQCGEYCGQQHARMAFEVVADAPDQYEAWRKQQLQPASEPPATAQQGQALFATRCGMCHSVRGTTAGGILGPDLTHIMSRRMIGAASLPNNIGNLAAWIADPQHVKPGNLMPRLDLSGVQLTQVREYVQTLK
jgi:cytochrome c oxidase subunit II